MSEFGVVVCEQKSHERSLRHRLLCRTHLGHAYKPWQESGADDVETVEQHVLGHLKQEKWSNQVAEPGRVANGSTLAVRSQKQLHLLSTIPNDIITLRSSFLVRTGAKPAPCSHYRHTRLLVLIIARHIVGSPEQGPRAPPGLLHYQWPSREPERSPCRRCGLWCQGFLAGL